MASFRLVTSFFARLNGVILAVALILSVVLPFAGKCGPSCQRTCSMHLSSAAAAQTDASPAKKSCCHPGISAPNTNALAGKCCCQLVPNSLPEASKPTTFVAELVAPLILAETLQAVTFAEPIANSTGPLIGAVNERGPPDTHFPAVGLRAPPAYLS